VQLLALNAPLAPTSRYDKAHLLLLLRKLFVGFRAAKANNASVCVIGDERKLRLYLILALSLFF
jgi:hypothetical protein